ncbi:hypothetical protein ZEAMMB73_Zm00001d004250 [Zea mays]|jgi:hypothetical protein|uniref:Uncharacterized protein n=1 Tax=Zea mays TaxID=4577 RepID=A0A1D6EEP1_MAIZE|nr:hypothetical protein ZEAMMB73_Zm00001d004250 [Zea mays]
MATTMKTAKVVLLVIFLVQVLSVLAAAARPLAEGDAGTDSWLESGVGMLTQLLLGAKSGSNPRTHCC